MVKEGAAEPEEDCSLRDSISAEQPEHLLHPPPVLPDDSDAEFYHPAQQLPDANAALIASLKSRLRWHEEVRDWISSVGKFCAPQLIEQGMAPPYLRFGGILFSG